MFENIKEDFSILPGAPKVGIFVILLHGIREAEFRAVILYRIGNWCHRHRIPFVGELCERLMHHLCHCWISTRTEIGAGFRIAHVCGIIVHPKSVIGKRCTIRQNVTIGGNYGKKNEAGNKFPILGDNVSIGPSASILGPIHIGDNSIVGANAMVTISAPNNSVISGPRAEVIGEVTEGKIIVTAAKDSLSRKELSAKLCALEKEISELQIAVQALNKGQGK